jgi:hypothetical protein
LDGASSANDAEESNNISQHQTPSLEPATAEELIRDWEHLHNTRLPKKLRKFALLIAAIHLDEDKGITVQDIKVLMNCPTINAAERRKDDAVRRRLLVPHASLKDGKQKQYFLSNYIHIINEKMKRRYGENPVSPDDISLALIKVLSERRCAYHHISLKTELKYREEDYKYLNSNNWSIESTENKTKTATFKLQQRRNCTLNISPNGTVMISIECTTNQYKLHTDEGIAELFFSCGQIYGILQQEANNRLNAIPNPIDWKIVQFDNDKTISIEELEKEYPKINWHSKAGLTIRSVSAAFRMYVKEMPEQGPSLRNETIASFKNSNTISEKIKEIAKETEEHTPDDFIKKELRKRNNDNKDEY